MGWSWRQLLTKRILYIRLALTSLVILIPCFQSCGGIHIMQMDSSSNVPAQPVVSLSDIYVETTLNHPKTVQIQTGVANTQLSLSQDSVVTQEKINNASIVIDPVKQTLLFTPDIGFRGTVHATVYATYQNVTNVQNITFQVDNPLLDFKPALAIRAPDCISCHANVQGDFVTDFGFKSAIETGPDFFLTAPNGWISTYGVAQSGADDLATASILGRLAIPKINLASLDSSVKRLWLPQDPTQMSPMPTSFADYLQRTETPTNTGFQGIVEQNLIYIGAPTVTDIMTNGQLSASQRMNFYKNTQSDPDVSGMTRVQVGGFDYFTNSATLICEGDLFIDGVVFLDHLNLQTTYGCRIYATHTVFINGPITYTNVLALSNLEIASAVGIYMGFGSCIDCADSSTDGYAGQNTLTARWNIVVDDGALQGLRGGSIPDHIAAITSDFASVSSTISSVPPAPPAGVDIVTYYKQWQNVNNLRLLDCSNSFVGEGNTTYSRLLLNAPVVMSRYSGDFQGVVIAEFAMWRLGAFTFNFDPVFTGVALLPFLDFTKILQIQ